MKKVLFVCPSYPPEGGGGTTRVLKFSKYLIDYGWQSVIVTMQSNASGVYAPYLLEEVPDVTEVHHVVPVRGNVTSSSNVGSFSKRFLTAVFNRFISPFLVPDRYVVRLPKVVISAVNLIRRNKIRVFISSSPCHSIQLAGYLIKKITGKAWVLDFRDGWIENVFMRPKNKAKCKIEYLLEELCLRTSDKIIVTTEEHKEKLQLLFGGIPTHKIMVITNGYDEEEFSDISEKQRDKFLMSYMGSIGYKRMPTFFLESLMVAMHEDPRIKNDLIVNFYGASSHRAKEEVLRLGLEGVVHLNDQAERKKSMSTMVNSDILLDFITADRGADHIVSGKLFEYLRAGKVILAFCDEGPEARLIRKMNSGVVVTTRNVASATRIILKLYNEWKLGELRVGSNTSVVGQFERKVLTKKLAGLLDSL